MRAQTAQFNPSITAMTRLHANSSRVISCSRFLPVAVSLRLIAIAACLGKTFVEGALPSRWLQSFPRHLEHFLVGLLLVDVYVTDWKETPATAVHWDFIAVAAWWGFIAAQMTPVLWHGFFLVAALAYIATFRRRLLSSVLSHSVLTISEGVCYTRHLYHGYVICFAGKPTVLHLREVACPSAQLWQPSLIVPLKGVAAP